MNFQDNFMNCNIIYLDEQKINISGSILNYHNISSVLIIAPNPVDIKGSYSGKGLPFPCAEIAFDNTPNKHLIDSESKTFNVIFSYPNSYYSVADKHKIISSVFFVIEFNDGNKIFQRFELEDRYYLRTLINRESRIGPEFYSNKYNVLPIDTAEQLMYQYAIYKTKNKAA